MVEQEWLSLSTEKVQNIVSWISYQEQTLCAAYTSSSPSVPHSAPLFPLSNKAWLGGSLSVYLINSISAEKDRPLPLTSALFPFCTSRIAASLLPLQLLSALHQKFCLHTPLPACKPPSVFPAAHTTPSTEQARPLSTCACRKSDLLHIKPNDFQCLKVPVKT